MRSFPFCGIRVLHPAQYDITTIKEGGGGGAMEGGQRLEGGGAEALMAKRGYIPAYRGGLKSVDKLHIIGL